MASNAQLRSAVNSLIWGNTTLFGKYNIPPGTVFWSSGLLSTYFDPQCFSVSACARGGRVSHAPPHLLPDHA